MKTEKIDDYAMPCMQAENSLKLVHQAMLDKDYLVALGHCLDARGYILQLIESIRKMREKYESSN